MPQFPLQSPRLALPVLAALTAATIGCGSATPKPASPAPLDSAQVETPPAPPDGEDLVRQGNEALADGNTDEAIRAFTEVIVYSPAPTAAPIDAAIIDQAMFQRGAAYMEKGFPDTAIEDFSAVLLRNPNDSEALCRRGAAYLEMNDVFKALDDCTASIRRKSDNPRAYLTRGAGYLQRGLYARAIADLQEARRQNVKGDLPIAELLGKSYYHLGEQLRSTGDEKQASAAMALANEFNSPYVAERVADQTRTTGAPFMSQRHGPETPTEIHAKPVLEPSELRHAEAEAHVRKAELLRQAGDVAEAINAYGAALALEPDRAPLYEARAELWLRLGFADTALLDVQQALRLSESATAFRLEAEAFLEQGNNYRAIESASQSMRHGPLAPETLAIRGTAYLRRKSFDEAIRDLEYAIEQEKSLAAKLKPLLDEAQRLRDRVRQTEEATSPSKSDRRIVGELGRTSAP